MLRSRSRPLPLVLLLASFVVAGASLAYQPAPADAQTIECFIRVCTVQANGDRICSEKKIDCPKPGDNG